MTHHIVSAKYGNLVIMVSIMTNIIFVADAKECIKTQSKNNVNCHSVRIGQKDVIAHLKFKQNNNNNNNNNSNNK